MGMKRRRAIILGGLAVAVILITTIFFATRNSAKPIDFVTVPASTGLIRTVVNATGNIQPVVTVQVGSQISGQVQEIYADFNTVVKRGQILAKIDPRNFQAQLTNAQAKVAATRAAVQSSQAQRATAV